MLTIDLRTAYDVLHAIVTDFGPRHKATSSDGANGCTYYEMVNNVLKPVCIVGQFFSRLGLMRALFSNTNEVQVNWAPGQLSACQMNTHGAHIRGNAERMGVVFTDEAWELLSDAQLWQDGRTGENNGDQTWGSALVYAAKRAHEAQVEALPTNSLVKMAVELAKPVEAWEKELLSGNPWDNHNATDEPPF